MGKVKKNRKKNDDESSNLEVGRSIATLKQKKTSAKSSFTRTRHKFEELLNEDLPSSREVKEYKKKIDEQLQQVIILLTELFVLYEQSKNLDGQNRVVDEMEKIDTEYSNIMNQAKEYLYNRKDESSSIAGTVPSKVRRLQQDEIDAQEKIKEIEREFKQKQEELEPQRTELEKKYKMEMQVLDEKLASEGKKFELSKKEVLDIPEVNSSCDLDSIKSEQIHDHSECRKEIQLEKPDVNKESSTQKIGQDLWRQPKRVSVPVKVVMRTGSQSSLHVWIRFQQLQNTSCYN